MTADPSVGAGWYRDPAGRYQERWWNGATWTGHVRGPLTLSTASLVSSPTSRPEEPPTDPVGVMLPITQAPPADRSAGSPAAAPRAAAAPRVGAASHASPLLRWSTAVLACVYGGAALVAFGAFLPWVKASAGAFSASKSGIEGDGVFTLVLAVVIVISFTLVKSRRAAGTTALSLGAVTGVVAGYELFDISSKADAISTGLDVSASPGVGLLLTGLAACAIVVGAALALGEDSTD
jgi:Protein of unknown function (DUF2510)